MEDVLPSVHPPGFQYRGRAPEGKAFQRGDPLRGDPFVDPLFQGASKLYQRRKEIEAELRREFSVPEDHKADLLRNHAAPRMPQHFFPPPPPIPTNMRVRGRGDAPSPAPSRNFPPPMPGQVPGPGLPREWSMPNMPNLGTPRREADVDLPPMPPPVPGVGRDRSRAKAGHDRDVPPVPPPIPSFRGERFSRGAESRSPDSRRGSKAPSEAPDSRREPTSAEERSHSYPSAPPRVKKVDSGNRGDGRDGDKLRRKQSEVDEAMVREQEEAEAWEQQMRKKFEEDERQRRLGGRRKQGDDDDKDPPRSERASWEARNEAAAEAAAEAKRRRQQAEGGQSEREAKEKAAHTEAKRHRWMREQAERARRERADQDDRTNEARERGRDRRRRRADDLGGEFSASPEHPPTPKPASYMQRSLGKSVSLPSIRLRQERQEEIRKAEAAAMKQMGALQLMSKKERQKGFKELLRAWHPDKNPENAEVATAVFQKLQVERARILGMATLDNRGN